MRHRRLQSALGLLAPQARSASPEEGRQSRSGTRSDHRVARGRTQDATHDLADAFAAGLDLVGGLVPDRRDYDLPSLRVAVGNLALERGAGRHEEKQARRERSVDTSAAAHSYTSRWISARLTAARVQT